jgi:hypothetical protein
MSFFFDYSKLVLLFILIPSSGFWKGKTVSYALDEFNYGSHSPFLK